jgi:hypothetical protein
MSWKKLLENHAAAISLYFMYYNFCRVHQTLRVPGNESRPKRLHLVRGGIGGIIEADK